MDLATSSIRPTKRRKTKRNLRFTEGDDILADGIIVKTSIKQTADGSIEQERIEVPIWSNKPEPTRSSEKSKTDKLGVPPEISNNSPEGYTEGNFYDFEPDSPGENERTQFTQTYYIQEFVDRVHPMLNGILAREVIPSRSSCVRCPDGSIAIWRCRDCTAARLLCRACIRDCHMDCPTHRLEVWTGNYFRPAEPSEAGLYFLIPHHTDPPHICATLKFQRDLLCRLQKNNDMKEQAKLAETDSPSGLGNRGKTSHYRGSSDIDMEGDNRGGIADDDNGEEEDFSQFSNRLDNMYRRRHEGDEDVDENEEDIIEEDEIDNLPPCPEDYMPLPPTTSTAADAADTVNKTFSDDTDNNPNNPRTDALNNPYVRVVHTNGVHHIALVFCSCRGKEYAHSDLMAAGLVPTSFTRYRTLFTHAALDDFRLSNLECKASAYQYFQKLRRQTSPMSPDTVPNLYHGLRRMSRLWRWLKKLKWAGVGHRPDGNIETKPGELANFCPACPQPNINLPDNWCNNTEERYVRNNRNVSFSYYYLSDHYLLVGFINVPLLPMETSRRTMSVNLLQRRTYGSLKEGE
jgi:CxC2 like cysteine cluster associated with KDZ transposases